MEYSSFLIVGSFLKEKCITICSKLYSRFLELYYSVKKFH